MLRPIGTRFTIHFPKCESSTDPFAYDHIMEVVGHIKAMRFLGDTEGIEMEEAKTIDIIEVPDGERRSHLSASCE